MPSFSFNQPPQENIKFLESKKPQLSFNYNDLSHQAHLKAFTIAKITKLDLLKDIQDSLLKAQKEGKSFESWKKDIKPTLAKKGWLGEVEATNPRTGEVKTIKVDNARLRRIYNTNMRTANAQGRAKAQYALKGDIYLRYVALNDGLARESHLAMQGITLHRDDAFWINHYPPNAWNCRCVVRAYTKEECENNGWNINQKAPPSFAHKDWSYDLRGLDAQTSRESMRNFLAQKALKYKNNPPFLKELNTCEQNYYQASKNYQSLQKMLALKGKQNKLTLATLPLEIQKALGSKSHRLFLSYETLQSHLQKHTEVTLIDYSLLPLLLQGANIYKIKETKNHHILIFSRFGKHYRAAIKTTSNKAENYLVSLVKGSRKIEK